MPVEARMYDDVYGEVVLKLKAAARTNRVVEAAQVHLINLGEIISRAGRHWPHVRERIRNGSVSFLRGCLSDEDIIIPCGDGFLIIFAQGERAELAARCVEIQGLLTAFYTGEEGLEALHAQVHNKSLEQGSFDALISESRGTLADVEPQAGFGDHQIMFTPVWSARAELVAAHLCQPTYCDVGVVRAGYNADYRLTGRHEHAEYAALDCEILEHALAAVVRLEEQGWGGIIGACVHASTLRQLKTRMAYFTKLSGAPHALTQRLLIRVAEIEVGAPPFTLADWIGFLRGHVRRVALEYHYTERQIDQLADIGAWAAGFQLPTHRRDAPDAQMRVMREQIALWARAAQRQQVKLMIDGFRSTPLLHAARDSGLELATSETFWPSAGAPGRVTQAAIPSLDCGAVRVGD